MALGRRARNAQHLSGLIQSLTGKESKFNDLEFLGMVLLEFLQLVVQRESRAPVHADQIHRVPPPVHAENYGIDQGAANPTPTSIGVFDDVLVTGSQFKAMQTVLEREFPGVPIIGIFIARRVP